VVALDPDIPPARQRIRLSAQGVADARWRMDGKPLAAGHDGHNGHDGHDGKAWAPWPGRHRLELLDRQGRVLDKVEFEVRGAAVKITMKK
jgi:penicillin-binding protein 1C